MSGAPGTRPRRMRIYPDSRSEPLFDTLLLACPRAMLKSTNLGAVVPPVAVFCSYSHKDSAFRDELEKHLSILKRQKMIKTWHDRKISAGTEWAGRIDERIRTAHIILLLISADFVASDYCYDVEMQLALRRHDAGEARVIPIILRDVDWRTAPFAKLQVLPEDGKAVASWAISDQAFRNVADGIRKAVTELRALSDGIDQIEHRTYSSNITPLAQSSSLLALDKRAPALHITVRLGPMDALLVSCGFMLLFLFLGGLIGTLYQASKYAQQGQAPAAWRSQIQR